MLARLGLMREREMQNLAGVLRLSALEAAGFFNRLTLPAPDRQSYPRAWKTLLVLLFIAFLPRLVMAWRIPTVCADGIHYISLADQRERGVVDSIQQHGNGLYPRILAGLHSTGMSWETAGEAWGVLCGSLVVLPFFGWIRRQFSDSVAIVSCLIYAAHPELIEWSPELIRDQTFWLLQVSSLYFMWRGIVEVRVSFHVAAAISMIFCMLCRFEGVFLIIPYVWWSAVRFRHLLGSKGLLTACLVAAFVVPPTALVASGKSSQVGNSVSRLFYTAPWERVKAWWLGSPTVPETIAATTGEAPTQVSLRLKVWSYLRTIERGITEVLTVLILLGLAFNGRLFFRSDHVPILLICLATAAGIWIHMWYSGGEASSRYSLPIAIFGIRCAAIGLMRFNDLLWNRSANLSLNLRAAMASFPMVIVLEIGCWDAISTQYNSRETMADLGRWVHQNYGDDCRLAGNHTQLEIAGFYAHSAPSKLSSTTNADHLIEQIRQSDPDVVVLSRTQLIDPQFEPFLVAAEKLGLKETRPDIEHPLRNSTIVLGRSALRR